MDPFTQRMLERAKSRREKLDNQKMILKHRAPLQEKVNLSENTLSEECLDTEQEDTKKEKQFITAIRKSKLQKLAKFYSTNNENALLEDDECNSDSNEVFKPEGKSQCKLGRLNELASKIKEWEDELQPSKKHIKSFQDNITDSKGESPKRIKTTEKQTVWDSSMVEKLCSEGFSRSESQSRLTYDFKKEIEKRQGAKNSEKNPNEKAAPKTEKPLGNRNEVLRKAAFFESTTKESPNKSAKDPAELSLAERKALFEKCKGDIVLPRNQFLVERKHPDAGGKSTRKGIQGKEPLAFISTEAVVEANETSMAEKLPSRKNDSIDLIPEDNSSLKIKTWSIKESQTLPEPPPMPSSHSSATSLTSSLGKKEKEESVKTISPKNGRLYPSLSSLVINEECEVDESQTEFLYESENSHSGLNMTLSDLLELNKNNPTTPPGDQSFSQSKECQVLNKMDRLLEDALNDLSSEEDSDSVIPTPPKVKKSSSFVYKGGSGESNPLLHTVSFYRKQQQSSCVTSENLDGEDESKAEDQKENEDESILVQNKIQRLLAEVNMQQTIISQASQALNLCLSTVEFSGSGEQVEGERLLLLASQKRQACLNEIQRLKVENSLLPQGRSEFLTERGDVNLVDIFIKLKRDALRSIAAAENLRYFVCLIKSDEQVLATPVVPATKENLKDMALRFPGQIKLENLLSNFKITVEVYNLELSKELLPHDVKYHIVNKKEKKLLTPIKSKKSESKLVKPNLQSPAGPNAVRTSNFQMCGYIVFSLREITRTQWILNRVPYVSPVEGTISMTIKSQLRLNEEFRGFLTMFDDISGFGAWHRRWCLLSSHFISYWKYPDDETKKVPIGTIDLRSVTTENVGLVSRDICARLNTFLLETTRPRLSGDKNSLVVSVQDDATTIRHLLSADSKHEMTTWCKKLNTALALLRSWKCNSMRSLDVSEDSPPSSKFVAERIKSKVKSLLLYQYLFNSNPNIVIISFSVENHSKLLFD